MRTAIGIVALLALAGCAGQNLKSENAELKAQVSALQTQVADLRAENAKLAAASMSPVAIDGLKLDPPKVGELRFTPPPPARPAGGPPTMVMIAGHAIQAQDIEVGQFTGSLSVHASPQPATKTAAPATAPQK